ncbi:alpha-glucosidase C-terminal domain-containing protein [Maribacter litopenaei]|uniref:alpha-amylase family glycosyl hydrolase n=1 Tax=Maribacter litopenaei TaxID=2976127 RepID=UPI0030842C63
MRGTPYCYYGDELGMTNIGFDTIEEYQDIAAINGYKKVVNQGGDIDAYLKDLKFSSRDNGRTPMQWDDSDKANFTSGKPWLPVNENYTEINVALEETDPNSVLNHFKALTKLRKEHDVLVYGGYKIIAKEHPTIYAYTRTLGNEKIAVLLNFSTDTATMSIPDNWNLGAEWINNLEPISVSNKQVELLPYQAVIITLK